MPTKNGSGRGSGSTATTNPPGNQTPNTPDINESEIARLKVDQLRDRLRRRGVTGTAEMRKDDLVKALVKAMKDGAKKSTSTRAGGSSGSGSSRSGSAAKKSTSSANTPSGTSRVAQHSLSASASRTATSCPALVVHAVVITVPPPSRRCGGPETNLGNDHPGPHRRDRPFPSDRDVVRPDHQTSRLACANDVAAERDDSPNFV